MNIKVLATDRRGVPHELSVKAGTTTVMEAMRDAGLPVEAVCGGVCSCATCHVFVSPDWMKTAGARGDIEGELLQMAECFDEATSRLACQIHLTYAHDGIRVTLAPEE